MLPESCNQPRLHYYCCCVNWGSPRQSVVKMARGVVEPHGMRQDALPLCFLLSVSHPTTILSPEPLWGKPDSCHCRLSSEDGFAVCLFRYHRHISSAGIKLISSGYFPISNHSKKTDFALLNTGSITLETVNGLSKDFSTYRRVSDSLSICCIKPIRKSQF